MIAYVSLKRNANEEQETREQEKEKKRTIVGGFQRPISFKESQELA